MMMDLMRGRVIVTYGRSLMALAIAESLGRRGIEVIGADDVGLTALSFSRFTKATFVHAPAATDPDAFIEDLVAAVLRFKPDDGRRYVLIPCFQETRLIARHAARLTQHITVAAPAFEAIDAVDPKDHLMRSLRDLPIRAPATCTGDEWRASAPACPARFPLMIKPNWGVGGRGVHQVDDAATLETAIRASDGAGGGLLVQDLIAGDDYCLCALFHNGELQATAAYHNLSQYPHVAGAGVLRETVSDAPFLPAVQALVSPLRWTGVAEIDFRWDRITTPRLIEVNPRFWAGVFHTSTSGVDFPWMLYEMAVTGKVSAHSAARLGQRTRVGDLYLLSAIVEIAGSDDLFAAAKNSWIKAAHRFQGGKLREAVHNLAIAATEGLDDLSRVASRLQQVLASGKGAPDELFRSEDPMVSLGVLFIVASLLRYGRLPPELRYDPMAHDLIVE
jgi:predicted ATP-grasp superfamily ATP-dependent carboligase